MRSFTLAAVAFASLAIAACAHKTDETVTPAAVTPAAEAVTPAAEAIQPAAEGAAPAAAAPAAEKAMEDEEQGGGPRITP